MFKSSELQKRDYLSSKLTSSQSNQSVNSLHINHLNLDSTSNSSNNARLNVRNKSASVDHSQQSNNTSSSQQYRVSHSLAKNYIDFNVQIPQLQSPSNQQPVQTQPQQQIPLYQLTNRVQSSRGVHASSHHHNLKIINDSNKFLEDILAHSKRNTTLKSSTAQAQSNVSQTTSVNSSVQLPSNVTNVNRTSEEKAMFPDKLIMERKNLNYCPIVEGEDLLKLINYQHNQIRSIQNLDQMRSLIFLDLYDNRIEKISGLNNLINLRVLMLGKNRIGKIENLSNLVYLDILDLHGNQV